MKRHLPYPFSYLLFVVILFICLEFPSVAQTVDYGKSYINLTKGTAGGTIEPGDILQIKATFVVKSGTFDSCGFFDHIPAGTSYIPGSLSILTNEGKIYKSFTDAAGDDCGWIAGTAVNINLGFNAAAGKQASAFRRGQIKNSDKPSFFGSTCIMVASYKIQITAGVGSQLNLGGGSVTYKSSLFGVMMTSLFPTDNVAVFTNYGLCANSVGANAIGTEFNGTFGSGKNKDRGTSANVPPSYTYAQFSSNNPNDYYYGVSNNTSTAGAGYSILNSWPKPDPSATSHRVFGVWDIIGDHTGAVSPTLGNPPADTVNKNNGGYMLVVNASYRIDSAFYQNISGLCPNTYYEFSLWMRNICSKCGCDSNGKGASSAGYIPTAANDSSGVKPNLTLAINGIDYYTTGDIAYDGLWVKKGFTYLTGPSQNSLTAMVRNNAPGGGGNDWAIDDISLATCAPNLNLQPSPNLVVCAGNQVDMSGIISSYFSNYIYWEWEKSTDNGATWTSTGVTGTGNPVLVSGQYQYTATYPSFLADVSMNHTMFRIKVAAAPASLNNPSCVFTASTTVQVLTSTCLILPGNQLVSFRGKLSNGLATLAWTTTNEKQGLYFEIEKSTDAIHFQKTGTVNAVAKDEAPRNYTFTDNEPVNDIMYYRIKLVTATGFTYSQVIILYTGNISFEIKSLVNPFDSYISFDAVAPADMKTNILLFDSFGRLVKQKEETFYKGFNKVTFTDLDLLSNGTYFLRIQADKQVINKRVIKIKN